MKIIVTWATFLAILLLIIAVLSLAVMLDIETMIDLRSTPQPLAAPFTDIQGHWAEPYIEQIRLAGLTAGCQTDPPMFCPDRPLTRAEAAVFMARILDLQDAP